MVPSLGAESAAYHPSAAEHGRGTVSAQRHKPGRTLRRTGPLPTTPIARCLPPHCPLPTTPTARACEARCEGAGAYAAVQLQRCMHTVRQQLQAPIAYGCRLGDTFAAPAAYGCRLGCCCRCWTGCCRPPVMPPRRRRRRRRSRRYYTLRTTTHYARRTTHYALRTCPRIRQLPSPTCTYRRCVAPPRRNSDSSETPPRRRPPPPHRAVAPPMRATPGHRLGLWGLQLGQGLGTCPVPALRRGTVTTLGVISPRHTRPTPTTSMFLWPEQTSPQAAH